jgi:hypothetical protein
MAIGDAAAAAGLAVFASAQDKRLGYQNDNQRGDDIAVEIAARAAADTALGASTAALSAGKLDASKIVITPTGAGAPAVITGGIWFKVP